MLLFRLFPLFGSVCSSVHSAAARHLEVKTALRLAPNYCRREAVVMLQQMLLVIKNGLQLSIYAYFPPMLLRPPKLLCLLVLVLYLKVEPRLMEKMAEVATECCYSSSGDTYGAALAIEDTAGHCCRHSKYMVYVDPSLFQDSFLVLCANRRNCENDDAHF